MTCDVIEVCGSTYAADMMEIQERRCMMMSEVCYQRKQQEALCVSFLWCGCRMCQITLVVAALFFSLSRSFEEAHSLLGKGFRFLDSVPFPLPPFNNSFPLYYETVGKEYLVVIHESWKISRGVVFQNRQNNIGIKFTMIMLYRDKDHALLWVSTTKQYKDEDKRRKACL